MKKICAIALVAALAAHPSVASETDEGASLEELVWEGADTPEEHEALADHFKRKADGARAEAAVHRRMGRSTGALSIGLAVQMRVHCKSIYEMQTALAKQYDEVADLHKTEAKRLRESKR